MADPKQSTYGHRARIGYTSPPVSAEVFPYEFYKVVPDGVTLVISTLAVSELSKAEIDESYTKSMAAARAMVEAGVDVMVFGGVPVNLSRGEQDTAAIVAGLEAELKVKVSTSVSAQEKAAKTLGCRKVVIAHAYGDSQSARQAGYAKKFGCEVLAVSGFGATLPRFGCVPRDAALTMGRKLLREHRDADAIFFPSPHWPTIEAIDLLEREFRLNVMSASQAAIWDGLRLAGVSDRIEGYGRLLREF